MQKKIYISLPIAIAEDTVYIRYKQALEEITSNPELQNYELCPPVNIDQFIPGGIKEPRTHEYGWYMGQDIEKLLSCNAIYMSKGWATSKGCNAELAVAKIYGIPVYYAEDIKNYKF